nr:PREDICTED: uncharacterized protein LOC108217641 [Daucus carota subsp. sativus]
MRHLHSLHRQGPPLQHPTQNPNPQIINPNFIPNRPIFNPNPHSIYPVHHVLNPNCLPQPPIFNSNPRSVHLICSIANPNALNNRPAFNPRSGLFYPKYDRSIPILNHDHRPHGSIEGYDSNGSGYSGRVSNVQPYLQSNAESVRHGNLNSKLIRLSLGVQGTKPKNMKKKGNKGGGGGGYEEVDPLIFVHDLFVVVHAEHQAFAVSDRVGLESRGRGRRFDSQITLNRDVSCPGNTHGT